MTYKKYYRFNINTNEWKNTLTTREHGLGELQDQAPSLVLVFVVLVRHIIDISYHRCWRTQWSVCPARLWTALRVQGVRCLHRHCLHVLGCQTDQLHQHCPLLALLSLFHVVSRSCVFASFLGAYFLGKIWIFRTRLLRTVLPTWGRWVLWAPPRESWIYMLWGIQSENRRILARSSVAITRSSVAITRSSHGWPRGNRPIAARRGPFIGIGGSPFDSPDDIVRSSDGACQVIGYFPLHFGRWPPDRRSMIGRCPTGRGQMRKSGEESADHLANFNCELNLPDHRRMSPGWGPGWGPDFCRIRAPDHPTVIRR